MVVDQLRFESPMSEFRTEDTYLKNAVINVAGFVPLGFACWLYFRTVRKTKHAALITILIGATVSLAIEYFQSYLPTRFSGVSDLITNTVGTWIGVKLCSLVLGRASRYWAGRSTARPSQEIA
jgi:glycopeptide antibiotics resistance protein